MFWGGGAMAPGQCPIQARIQDFLQGGGGGGLNDGRVQRAPSASAPAPTGGI